MLSILDDFIPDMTTFYAFAMFVILVFRLVARLFWQYYICGLKVDKLGLIIYCISILRYFSTLAAHAVQRTTRAVGW